jgi:hypothetical protein
MAVSKTGERDIRRPRDDENGQERDYISEGEGSEDNLRAPIPPRFHGFRLASRPEKNRKTRLFARGSFRAKLFGGFGRPEEVAPRRYQRLRAAEKDDREHVWLLGSMSSVARLRPRQTIGRKIPRAVETRRDDFRSLFVEVAPFFVPGWGQEFKADGQGT